MKLRDERDSLAVTYRMAREKAALAKDVHAALGVMDAWAEEALRDKRVRVTPEVEAEIWRLRGLGYSAHAIAPRVGLTEPTVRARVGVVRERPQNKR